MTNVNLEDTTIGAIREFINSQTSRDQLKELALKAGANADRIIKNHGIRQHEVSRLQVQDNINERDIRHGARRF